MLLINFLRKLENQTWEKEGWTAARTKEIQGTKEHVKTSSPTIEHLAATTSAALFAPRKQELLTSHNRMAVTWSTLFGAIDPVVKSIDWLSLDHMLLT